MTWKKPNQKGGKKTFIDDFVKKARDQHTAENKDKEQKSKFERPPVADEAEKLWDQMSQKDKYEKWGHSPYLQGSFLIYQARILNKIKDAGGKPTDEDKEKVKKDWESLNLF